MPHWSAENATRAYLRTIKMGKRGKEPDVAEFISALAGGNNAKLMVEVCGSIAGPTTLGLVAAAHQTGGRVVCILPGPTEVQESKSKLSSYVNKVEFITGDQLYLLTNTFKGADFVTLDCNIENHKAIFKSAQKEGALVVGYNAHHLVPSCNELGGHFLPIGEGLLVSKVVNQHGVKGFSGNGFNDKRSKWITKVDRCTGEEHVFKVTCLRPKVIQA
ncbi:Phospholipase D LhSicTox-alphaIA2aii [Bienertia sinuspersici]